MFRRPADLMRKNGTTGSFARRATFLRNALDHVRRLRLTNCTLGKRNTAALSHSAHWSSRSDEILATDRVSSDGQLRTDDEMGRCIETL
jgi:hypothetical protein